MIVTWTPRALGDAWSIRRHIAEHNPGAALRLVRTLEAKADLLGDNPGLGRRGRLPGTREFVAHSSYILIYSVTPTAVRILRVMHTARQWPSRGR